MTLALGIGANTALFAVVEAVLLRPLPLSGADQLVILKHRDATTGITKEFLGVGDFIDIRERQQTMRPVAVYGGFQGTLFEGAEPTRVTGLGASPELFEVLRVQPAMGRLVTAEDARQGAPPVMMISYGLWETRFGSDPNIVRARRQLNATRRSVIGVLPARLSLSAERRDRRRVAVPASGHAAAQRKGGFTQAIGRIKAGQSLASVVTDLDALSTEFAQKFPSRIAEPSITRSHCAMHWSAIPNARCSCSLAPSASCC
jgi:hypothetical protein